jgi:hypothetical protein
VHLSLADSQEDVKGRKQRTRHKESNEDVEQRSSRTNNAAQSKTKKAPSQAYDNEENMPGNPIGAKGPSNKKPVRVATPKKKVKSTPLPPQSSISGFSFSNVAGGTMTNTGVGNIYNSTTSDVGNNDSEQARRKRA